MARKRLLTIFIAAAGIAGAVILGLFFFAGETGDRLSPGPAIADKTSPGLGITYLPVTPGVSEYYGLGVEYGALITEIAPDSPAARAGLKPGDVILSFNGARLEEPNPLLRMMMDCPAHNTMTVEISRQAEVSIIQLSHGER